MKYLVLSLFISCLFSCGEKSNNKTIMKNDSIINDLTNKSSNSKRVDSDFVKNQNVSMINEFKFWIKDTLSTIKKNSFCNYNEKGLRSKNAIVSSDSLFVDFKIRINDTVYSLNNYTENSYLMSTLYILKLGNVSLPKLPYEIRIEYTDSYFLSDDFSVRDRSYSYDYLSIRQLNSNKETCYSIIKGNLINTEEVVYQKEW